jgi:hypothetical protein
MIVYRELFFAFRNKGTLQKKKRAWWHIFTNRARFDHVAAFYYDTLFEGWQLIEWSELGLFFGPISDAELDRYTIMLCDHDGRILRYKAKERERSKMFPWISWSYCVSGAKHLANLRSPAMTPDQLFRALLRDGGRAAFTSNLEDGDDDGVSRR